MRKINGDFSYEKHKIICLVFLYDQVSDVVQSCVTSVARRVYDRDLTFDILQAYTYCPFGF